MTIQELMQTVSDFSEKSITLDTLVKHPVAWGAMYLAIMFTIGLAKTKAFCKTFADPVSKSDYLGAVICWVTSPIWILLSPVVMGACKIGKGLVGR